MNNNDNQTDATKPTRKRENWHTGEMSLVIQNEQSMYNQHLAIMERVLNRRLHGIYKKEQRQNVFNLLPEVQNMDEKELRSMVASLASAFKSAFDGAYPYGAFAHSRVQWSLVVCDALEIHPEQIYNMID